MTDSHFSGILHLKIVNLLRILLTLSCLFATVIDNPRMMKKQQKEESLSKKDASKEKDDHTKAKKRVKTDGSSNHE